MSRTRSTSTPFSARSVSAILALVIVVPFVSVICAKTTFAESHDGRSLMLRGRPLHTPRAGTRSHHRTYGVQGTQEQQKQKYLDARGIRCSSNSASRKSSSRKVGARGCLPRRGLSLRS